MKPKNYYLRKLRNAMLLLAGCIMFCTASAQTFPVSFTYSPSNPCISDTIVFTADTTIWGTNSSTSYWWTINGVTQSGLYTFNKVLGSGGYSINLIISDSTRGMFGTASDSIYVDSVCPQNKIAGHVFDDANNNGIKDGSETGSAFVTVGVNSGSTTYNAFTDANGDYEIMVHAGTYTVAVNPPLYRTITAPGSGSYSVTFTGIGGLNTGNDFGLYAPAVNDVAVYLTGTPSRPGANSYYTIGYHNVGTVTASGMVTLNLDSDLDFISSIPAPSAVAGNTISWNYSGLNPGHLELIDLTVYSDTLDTLGTPINNYVNVTPLIGDSMPGNNTDSMNGEIVASYDPNDKSVVPQGIGTTGRILPTEKLTYTIRFQNLGTSYAEDVRVEDEIDTDLNLESFNMIGASHPYTYQVNGNKITWFFDGIMLPDDKTDEPGSHGFIKYSINIANPATIPDFTVINNTADIYFDFNPAVVTNTTVNTIDRSVAWVGIDEAVETIGASIYPNPFTDRVDIVLNQSSSDVFVKVNNLKGQQVHAQREKNANRVVLELGDLQTGMYFVTIQTAQGSDVFKVMKR